MRRKLILITTVFILMLQPKIQATTIYASDGTEISDNSNICAYDSYSYETGSAGVFEASVISSDTRMLLQTVYAKNGVIEFVFPSNVNNLSIYIYNFSGDEKQLVDKYNLKLSDCGYEETVDNYSTTNPLTDITLDDTIISFTKPEVDNYHLYYNQIEENDDGKVSNVKFKNGIGNVELTSKYIQITEEYTNENDNKIVRYYEINLLDEPIIRKMNELDLALIEPMQYIDRSALIRIFFGLIVLVILYLINIKLIKKYKAKKEYKRKLKVLKEKNRKQAHHKQQEIEKNNEEAQQELNQKEKKQELNLKIRK